MEYGMNKSRINEAGTKRVNNPEILHVWNNNNGAK